MSPILFSDFYKTGHIRQYPAGTTKVFSNLTPRSTKHLDSMVDDKIVVFGIRAAVQELYNMWDVEFFDLEPDMVHEDINKLHSVLANSLGIENPNLMHWVDLYTHGSLPIDIRYLPEGTLVDAGTPVLTITNTDDRFFWLVNYLETWLSAQIWKPMTTATIARQYRKIGENYATNTGVATDFVDVQFHDFSYRGMAGTEDAMTAGMGHLTSFIGTDTIPAIINVEKNYGLQDAPIGVSVAATEHSVMCLGGKETERETFERLLEAYPTGIVSIVSDTWDYWKVLTELAPSLQAEIESRDGRVVFRPDSGDPVRIIAGYLPDEIDFFEAPTTASTKMYKVKATGEFITKEEVEGSVAVLAQTFGTTTNEAGYLELNEKVGLIYGDSITQEVANDALFILKAKGYASSNVVFGVGSFTYQYMTRDTLGIAVKATAGRINGEDVLVYKDPKTDDGTKKSLKGYFIVEESGVTDNLSLQEYKLSEDRSLLLPHEHHKGNFQDIRERIKSQ